MKTRKRRLLALCLLLAVCLTAVCAQANDSLPYDCYNYDHWNNILYTPAPYVPDGSVSGAALTWQGAPLGAFRTPQDLCVSPDGDLYLADTGNNRIVVLSGDLKTVKQVITGFEANGKAETFSAPYGVAVSQNRQLYIADSQNHRIVVLELDGSFRRCRWLGRGPGENYADCKANAPVGLYEANVEDMHFAYDVPQETGNHGDCRFVTVAGENGALTAEGAFSFSFHNFTLENLTAARHCDELETSEHNYLYIDHRQRGLGSHSCGPEPEKEYELPFGSFHWTVALKPGERDDLGK